MPKMIKTNNQLHLFVISLFRQIFGDIVIASEDIEVFNDPTADCPMLIKEPPPLRIRTNTASDIYWCQVVYQFSYELTHYIIRQYKVDKDVGIKWFEETVCEALSLYILDLVGKRWGECLLSKDALNYAENFISYACDRYNEQGTDKLKKCLTSTDLQKIENTCEERREDRNNERSLLFDLFKSRPQFIYVIVHYPRYIQPGKLLVDFDSWVNTDETTKEFLLCASKVQPKPIEQ
jgi:hypothetical protein